MAKTDKLDLYKEHKAEYAAGKKPSLVTVGAGQYLTIAGEGAPGGEAFQAKVGALYSTAFTIKMTWKFAGKRDYKVCPLEGLWWVKGKRKFSFGIKPDQWRWRLLIRTPGFITDGELNQAKEALRQKGKPPEFEQVQLETVEEGRCVQMLHVGPYDTEPQTIEAMRQFAEDNGLAFHGLHHEIYLSDPRRVPPERLRTVLRMPVRAAGR